MNIRLTHDPGLTKRPAYDEWAEKRSVLSASQRTVYLYVREKAARGDLLNLKTMTRELGVMPTAKTLWESHGALSGAAIRRALAVLETYGLVSFADDTERQQVLGSEAV